MLFRIIVIYCLGLLFFTLHEFQFNCSDPVLMKTDSLFSDFLYALFLFLLLFFKQVDLALQVEMLLNSKTNFPLSVLKNSLLENI